MEHEMQKMTLEEPERHELKRMKFDAFKVCDELTSRNDAAPLDLGSPRPLYQNQNYFSITRRIWKCL